MTEAADQGDVRERRRGARRGRRRGRAATLIAWRDIPAQLTAHDGDEQVKLLLHARFQHAIDRAATVAGLTSTDAYVREWRSTTLDLADGDIAPQLDAVGASIEAAHPPERLEALVAAGGIDVATRSLNHDEHHDLDPDHDPEAPLP